MKGGNWTGFTETDVESVGLVLNTKKSTPVLELQRLMAAWPCHLDGQIEIKDTAQPEYAKTVYFYYLLLSFCSHHFQKAALHVCRLPAQLLPNFQSCGFSEA